MGARPRLRRSRPSAALAALALACGDVRPPGPPAPPLAAPTAPAPSPSGPEPASADPTELGPGGRQRVAELAPKAEAILSAYDNSTPWFVGGGAGAGRFVFRSGRGGASELYLGDASKPGAPPRKLASGRVAFGAPTADGRAVVFLNDEGGDENCRLYRVGLDGSGEALLTPGEAMRRDEPLLPRRRPDLVAYSARADRSADAHLFVAPVEPPGAPRAVATVPGPATAVDVTADGARVLVRRFDSPGDQTITEVVAATGASRRIYPPEGARAGVASAAYAADGRGVYVGTDEGGDDSSLLLLDAASLAVKARYRAPDLPKAQVSVAVAPRGGRVAVSLDAGTHHRARVLDAATLALRAEVPGPPGSLLLGAFSADGKRFGLTRSLPEAPPDVFSVDATTGAVAPLRDDRREALEGLPPLDVAVERVRSFDGLDVPVNRYVPKGLPPGRRLPTLVWLHGGPASSSSLRWHPFARFFTSLGFAYLEPNVRGSAGFGRAYERADDREKRADVLRDLAAVNAWAREQPWCDAGRIVIMGGSYGGYLVLMALTRQPGLWRAGVDAFGPADLKTFLGSIDPGVRAAFADEFGDLEKDASLLERFSPLAQIDRVAEPLFVYHGRNDPRVPRSESDQIVRSLRSRHVPVEYMIAPDEGHGPERRATRVEFLARVARFLGERLGLPGYLPAAARRGRGAVPADFRARLGRGQSRRAGPSAGPRSPARRDAAPGGRAVPRGPSSSRGAPARRAPGFAPAAGRRGRGARRRGFAGGGAAGPGGA